MREEEKQEKNVWMVSLISMIFILGIFAIASLFLVNIGVQVYKNVVIANDENFELRTSLSYVATRIRQTDSIDMVFIEERDGLTLLVLEEELDGEYYQTLIYYMDGWLYEHFMEKDGLFEPGYGMETFEIHGFEIEQLENGQLHMTAENSTGTMEELYLSIRTGRQVAAR